MADCYGRLPIILRHSRKQEGDNSGLNRRNLRFYAKFAPYRYWGWDVLRRDRPSSRRRRGLILNNGGLLWTSPDHFRRFPKTGGR